MVLADTSVWIEHFPRGQPGLAQFLNQGVVLMHPVVVGELACGNLPNRTTVLSDLNSLPSAKLASHAEVMQLIEARNLHGLGLALIDAHLLASALISKCLLWTFDKRLSKVATSLKLT